MQSSPESLFNRAMPWYRSMTKGIQPPTLSYQKGEWRIKIPETWPDDVVREMCGWKIGRWEAYAAIARDTDE